MRFGRIRPSHEDVKRKHLGLVPMPWPRWIRDGSRSVPALIAVSVTILLVGFLLAVFGSRLFPADGTQRSLHYIKRALMEGAPLVVQDVLADESMDDTEAVYCVVPILRLGNESSLSEGVGWAEDIQARIQSCTSRPDVVSALLDYWKVLSARSEPTRAQALIGLTARANREVPDR